MLIKWIIYLASLFALFLFKDPISSFVIDSYGDLNQVEQKFITDGFIFCAIIGIFSATLTGLALIKPLIDVKRCLYAGIILGLIFGFSLGMTFISSKQSFNIGLTAGSIYLISHLIIFFSIYLINETVKHYRHKAQPFLV